MIVLRCIKVVSRRDSITPSLLQYRPRAPIGKAAEQREENGKRTGREREEREEDK